MKISLIAMSLLIQSLFAVKAIAATEEDLNKCYMHPKFMMEVVDETNTKQQLGYFQYVLMMMSDDDFAAQTTSGELKKTSQKIYDADPETARQCLEDIISFAKSGGDKDTIEFTVKRTRSMSSIVHRSLEKKAASSKSQRGKN